MGHGKPSLYNSGPGIVWLKYCDVGVLHLHPAQKVLATPEASLGLLEDNFPFTAIFCMLNYGPKEGELNIGSHVTVMASENSSCVYYMLL
jgi:hypothetical protein